MRHQPIRRSALAADGLERGTTGFNNPVADTNLLQASSSLKQAPSPGRGTTGPVPFPVPADSDVTNVQLLSLQVGATWTPG